MHSVFYAGFKVIGDIRVIGDVLYDSEPQFLHFHNEDNVFSFFITIKIICFLL